MPKNDDKVMDDLDGAFDAAKADAPIPTTDLMARILADAAAEQAKMVEVRHQPMPRQTKRSFLAEMFGGVAGVTALAACVGLGLIIGFSAPDAITPYLTGITDADAQEAFGLYFDSEF